MVPFPARVHQQSFQSAAVDFFMKLTPMQVAQRAQIGSDGRTGFCPWVFHMFLRQTSTTKSHDHEKNGISAIVEA